MGFLTRSNVILHGGPADGALVATDSASVLVRGEDHGRPGQVARYRRTRTKIEAGTLTVYGFKGWDEVIGRFGEPA